MSFDKHGIGATGEKLVIHCEATFTSYALTGLAWLLVRASAFISLPINRQHR